jgi:hypothetical protein
MSGLNLFLQPGTSAQQDQLPGTCQALLDYIAANTGIAGTTLFNGINFGSATPSPDNQNLPWFNTDSFGNPLGLYSWNGVAWTGIASQTSSGPSTSRPTSKTLGLQYYDTTIGGLIYWNGTIWTTVSGMVGDVKEVRAPDIGTALTNNPGWVQDTASIGMVIGGAGPANGAIAAHAYGSTVGEEAHTMLLGELVAHSHTEVYATYTGAFQNGPQPAGVLPAVTPASTGLPVASTNPSGGGAAFNLMQPTTWLWRLLKAQ